MKEEAEKLYNDLEIDLPPAIRLFIKQSLIKKAIPFTISLKADDFYNLYSMGILEQAISQQNAGHGGKHDLIEK